MLKNLCRALMVCCVAIVVGCANPLNQATSNRYGGACSEAERNGQLDVAEQACYRALMNVDWGNLGPEEKSQRLYNLARIKRRLAKFSEAEDLLKQSLVIEEKQSPQSEIKIGRRLVELSVNYAAQDKWNEGAKCLDRILTTMVQNFSGQDRNFTSQVFSQYGKKMRETNQMELAERYEAASAALK